MRGSKANVLLELSEFVGEEGKLAVDILGVAHDSVDLVGKSDVFCLLGN
jgi:hypothetical protein